MTILCRKTSKEPGGEEISRFEDGAVEFRSLSDSVTTPLPPANKKMLTRCPQLLKFYAWSGACSQALSCDYSVVIVM